MSKYALVGLVPDTLDVEIVASVGQFTNDHIEEIVGAGFLCVITSMELAKEKWGKRLNNINDLLVS